MEAIEGEILMDDIDKFTEVGACGTAAVVALIGSIYYKRKRTFSTAKKQDQLSLNYMKHYMEYNLVI